MDMTWVTLVLPALCVGSVLIGLAAPLGCLVVWRNMAFFSDTLAHGALLGLAIASLVQLPLWLGMAIFSGCLIVALWFLHDDKLPTDALLAGLSATVLSLGLIIISFVPELRSSMMAFLFGDLLAITWGNAHWYIAPCLFGICLLKITWRAQLTSITSEALSEVAGINPSHQKLIFMIILASFTMMAMQAVGSLLVSSLLILPALAARMLSQSPTHMVSYALVFGWLGISIGIAASLWLNVAAGLCVVLVLACLFLLTFLKSKYQGG